MNMQRVHNKGFTLIELLIVVGIISLLLVVLAVAVLPALSKGDEKASISLLQQVGPEMTSRTPAPTLKQFKKDAGSLAGRISSDEKIATSQMMLFYLAPSRSTWDGAKYYEGQNYAPKHQPEEFQEFTREEGGKLPHLVDAWDNPIWYEYDTRTKSGYVFSSGKDGAVGTPDDFIFDSRNNSVKMREQVE
ncbi:MAG: type II secretion system GspH family protein [Planctomycetes bacterium]|nr:type II secretion system GspH family protein [Planctomycetota bacterium]